MAARVRAMWRPVEWSAYSAVMAAMVNKVAAMLTIAKLKRWLINDYNDTAWAARQVARDARRGNGGLGEYYSESEIRELVWLLVGDIASAAKLVGSSDAERAGAAVDPDVAERWLDDGVAPSGASAVGL